LTDSGQLVGLSTEAIKLLIGDMGLQILNLVDQGCSDDSDLIRFSALSRSCLSVKIPLLVMLGLMATGRGGYRLTQEGEDVLEELLGWEP
jgi:predicted transcriptional regulator